MTLWRWPNAPQSSAVPMLCDRCFREIVFPGEYMLVAGRKYHVGCYCADMDRARVVNGEFPQQKDGEHGER